MNYIPINKIKTHAIQNHPSEMIYQLQESPPNKDEYANEWIKGIGLPLH